MGGKSKQTLRHIVSSTALAATAIMLVSFPGDGFAVPLNPQAIISENGVVKSDIVPVFVRREGAVRRTTVVGPRGGMASRTVARRGVVAGPGRRGGGVRWARPAAYGWRGAVRSPPAQRLVS
jgi:hypothetical protein